MDIDTNKDFHIDAEEWSYFEQIYKKQFEEQLEQFNKDEGDLKFPSFFDLDHNSDGKISAKEFDPDLTEELIEKFYKN